MRPAWLAGVGLFAPGYRDAAAWAAGAPDPAVVAPAAELLPAALRRRATRLARLAAEVAAQAARAAGADLAALPVVLGSAYGEVAAATEMMAEFRGEGGMPSPTRFHNSVHNTAAAYLSIAAGQRGFSTALAAGRETAAMALLEAFALLEERRGDALVLLLDEPAPEPFAAATPYPAAAVALLLASAPRPGALARLSGPRRVDGARVEVPGPLAAHPCAGGFALAAAAARGGRGAVAVAPGWTVLLDAPDVP